MATRPLLIAAGVAVAALLVLGGTALGSDPASQAASAPIRLAAATLIIEVDATVGDAGLQFFLDGEPWRSMTVEADEQRRGDVLVREAAGDQDEHFAFALGELPKAFRDADARRLVAWGVTGLQQWRAGRPADLRPRARAGTAGGSRG
jgi:hypothetical protein